MLKHLKKQLEKVVIASMIITLMLISAISWGKILTKDSIQTKPVIEKPTTEQATSQIKSGIVVFAGLAVMASEYLHLSDEE